MDFAFYAFITLNINVYDPDMFDIIASRQDIFVLGFWVSFSSEQVIGGPPFCLTSGFSSQGESQIYGLNRYQVRHPYS